MTQALEKLTAQELQALAGEIVRSLDGRTQAKPESQAASGTPELLRAVLDGNAESLQGLIRQAAEAVAAAAGASAPASVQQPESIAAETKPAAASAAQAGGTAQARFESSEKLIGAPDAAGAYPREVSGLRQDIAALSEHFRRDSRRYDVGFERF